jgi:shikimate kinase
MKQILYMLIGPKGAGKTYIGVLVNQYTDITFLRVEPIWVSLQPGEDGWKKVESIIDMMFKSHEKVMIESLGAGEGFRGFHASLAKKYLIKMIHIFADLDICLARVKNRNNIDHIAVSDDKVMEYNQIATSVTYNWALEIDNNGPAPDAEIIQAMRNLDDTIDLG